VIGNGSFAGEPLIGGEQAENLADTFANARNYLNNPTAPAGEGLDLYPRPGTMNAPALDTGSFPNFQDFDLDFNRIVRAFRFRGAYEGEGTNPGWMLQLDPKPLD
jgi:hypothetical protein